MSFNAEKQSSRDGRAGSMNPPPVSVGLAPRASRPMRDSGVEWIGQVPEGWRVGRVKNEFEAVKEIVGESFADYERLALTLNGVVKRPKDDTGGLQPEEFEGYQVLRENELVFKLIDLQNVKTSRIGRCPFDKGIVSPAYIVLRKRKGCDSRYAEYFFRSMWLNEVFNTMGDDSVRSCLNRSDLLNTPFLIVPEQQQRTIAAYLDARCGEIDAAVAAARQSIEDYKALKKALVFELVTGKRKVEKIGGGGEKTRVEVEGEIGRGEHGEHGERNMRDSGVAWIGAVPEGWRVVKTLYVLEMPITDGPHTTPELYDEGVPFVSAEAVSCGNGSIDFNHIRGFISEEFYQECCLKYVPRRNDIYMIKSGATTGRVSMVDTDRKFTIWSPLAVFRANEKRMLPRFMFYYLQSPCYQKEVELGWSFGTQQNIGMRALEALPVLVPPLAEQRAIADYLDETCGAIDALVAEKESLIADLEQYKKSLIFECVTGKREVA